MRKLTKEESELNKKGIDRLRGELKEHQKNLGYLEAHNLFLQQKRVYDDYVRPFNRAKEDKEMKLSIEGYKEEMKTIEEKIQMLKDQLKNGVQEKPKPLGIE